MTEQWEYFRWHGYPPVAAWRYNVGYLVRSALDLTLERRTHNPSVPISVSDRMARMEQACGKVDEELKRISDEDYEQRWLWKQLIETGECP